MSDWNSLFEQAKNGTAVQQPGEAQPPDDQGASLTDYATDIPKGIVNGGVGFVQSLGKMADNISESVFSHDLFGDTSQWSVPFKTKTAVGGLTEGVTQFAMSFIPLLGVAGGISKAYSLGTAGATALRLGAGAAADFLSFDGTQKKLSDLIESYPELSNPVTKFLSASPDDSWAEKRFKASLEGLGLAGITDLATAAFKGLRGVKEAEASGNKAAIEEAATTAAKDVSDAAGTGGQATDAASATGAAKDTTDRVLNNDPMNLDVKDIGQFQDAVTAHLNTARLGVKKSISDTIDYFKPLAENVLRKTLGETETLAMTRNMADEFVEMYGTGATMLKAAAEDAGNVYNLASRWLAYRTVRNGLAESILNTASQMKRALTAGGEVVTDLHKDMMGKVADFLKLHYDTQIIQTESARTVSSGRILAGLPDVSVESMVGNIQKLLTGSTKVNPEQLVNSILANGNDPKGLVALLDGAASTIGGKALAAHNEFWINSLLSGLHTQLANVTNQLAQTFLQPADRIFGGVVTGDMGSIRSGFRLYGGLVHSFFDFLNLANDGLRAPPASSLGMAAKATLMESPVLDSITSSEVGKAITAQNFGLSDANPMGWAVNWLGKAVRLPTRLMTGADEMFKQVNYRAYLRDEAMQLAEKQGVKGNDLGQFVADYVSNAFSPTGKALNDNALLYARRSTSTQPLSGLAGGYSQLVNDHPILRLVTPFVRTPTNVFKTLVEYTPGIDFLSKDFRTKWLSPDPMIAADARGRFMLGSMFWGSAATMAMTGKITGSGPSDPAQRQALLNTGWQPYSMRVENDDGSKAYVSFKRLEPLGMVMGLAADFADIHKHLGDDDSTALAHAMGVALANNITSRTYLTGITEVANALSAPDRYGNTFLKNRASSYIPTLLGQFAQDDYMHEARSIMDAVMRKIPGYAQDLPPKRNMFGENVPVQQGYLPFGMAGGDLAKWVSPVGYSQAVSDPVKDELSRMQYGFGLPPSKIEGVDLTAFKNAQGQDAYDYFQEQHGKVMAGGRTLPQALESLITSPEYQKLPYPSTENEHLNPRVVAIQNIIHGYRQAAQYQTFKAYPQIQSAINEMKMQQRLGGTTPTLQLLKQ